MCHGEQLQGIAATGAPAPAGGRGTLQAVPTRNRRELLATTLFDYIKRAMPFTQPGSLSDDEVYALCAYILSYGEIVPDDAVMTRTALVAMKMPNRVLFDNTRIYKFR